MIKKYEKTSNVINNTTTQPKLPNTTNEIFKTKNIRHQVKKYLEYSSDSTTSNNNKKSDSSIFPDSDYTPNTTNTVNKINPTSYQRYVRNKKSTRLR